MSRLFGIYRLLSPSQGRTPERQVDWDFHPTNLPSSPELPRHPLKQSYDTVLATVIAKITKSSIRPPKSVVVKKVGSREQRVKKGKRGACKQKTATVLLIPDRTAAT